MSPSWSRFSSNISRRGERAIGVCVPRSYGRIPFLSRSTLCSFVFSLLLPNCILYALYTTYPPRAYFDRRALQRFVDFCHVAAVPIVWQGLPKQTTSPTAQALGDDVDPLHPQSARPRNKDFRCDKCVNMSQPGGLFKGNGTPSAGPQAPPIVELARFLGQALSVSYGFFSRTTVAIVLSLIAPVTLLYYPLTYLFAPVIVLAQVLIDLLVFTPYAIVLSVARNVYPIYVFVGATCLCALGVGYFARALSAGITRTFFTPLPQEKTDELPEELPSPVEPRSEKSMLKASGLPKPRVKKRVSIKEERTR